MIDKLSKLNPMNIFTIVSLLLLVGCGGKVSGGTAKTDIESSGTETVKSQLMTEIDFETSGVFSGRLSLEKYQTPIEYGLSVPEIPKDQTAPLVLALHFSGGQGLSFLNSFALFGPAELDAIIISPTVPLGSDWSSIRTTTMLTELVELAVKNWPVDPQRVIVIGYSMGGFGTWSLLSSSPELFSAAIPIASSPKEWLETISTEVPIYAIHSEFDRQILLATVEEEILTLQNKGVDIQLIVAKNTDHFDVDILSTYLYDAMDWLKYTVWKE
jgi:predicted peptidase